MPANKKREIVINPVTRIEGHGKVTIYLDNDGQVSDARFHVLEYRGFEKFCEGRLFWEMPQITSRICGICCTSHHIASAKACDAITGVEITKTSENLRRLVQAGEIIQSHALHFFYLASPDLLLGVESEPQRRNVAGVIGEEPELWRMGMRIRKFGQEIFERLSGSRIHINYAIPGGVRATLSNDDRKALLKEIDEHISASERALHIVKRCCEKGGEEISNFARFKSNYLGLVDGQGNLDFYEGKLRMKSKEGSIMEEVEIPKYGSIIQEAVEDWSYTKFPYYAKEGYPEGMYRVGPLARVNVADRLPTPLAHEAAKEMKGYRVDGVLEGSMFYHYARMVEMIHALEKAKSLLEDETICSTDIMTPSRHTKNQGVGIIEAPRGTLIHHYYINDRGVVQRCNFIVATGHNNLAINRSIADVASRYIEGGKVREGIMNNVEVAIRCYDPCLSCSTHAMGQMPLRIEVISSEGQLQDRISR